MKFVTIYVRSTLHEQKEFFQNVKLWQILCKVFGKPQIFADTGHTHNLSFGPLFTPIYPLKMVSIKNNH